MKNRHLIAVGAAALVLAGSLAACSTDADAEKTVSDRNATAVRNEAQRQKQIARNLAALPTPPSGRVDLAGGTKGSITTSAARSYNKSGATTEVKISSPGAEQGFAKLCAGEVDLVDSARSITDKELAACRTNGLDVVQVQIAADAIVLAAKAESDVGGDCLDTTQLRTMFRAGSPISNWRQVKFSDVPMTVAGPVASESAFDLFSQLVLDRASPALSDLRSDYIAGQTELATLTDVIGSKEDNLEAGYLSSRKLAVTALRRELAEARTALAAARAEVTAAETDRQKGIADGRPAAQQAIDQARQDAAYPIRDAALVKRNKIQSKVKTAEEAATRSAAAERQLASRVGRVGVFGFSYYEREQEHLRAFEITRDGVRDCIFPSQRTIAEGLYPLSVPLLLTTTTRSLDRAEVRDFLTVHLDQVDQRARDASLIPPTADILAAQRAWVTGEAEPTLVASASERDNADAAPGPA